MKSNCLLEALKTMIINPRGNIFYQRGSWAEVFQRKWPHFYWYNIKNDKYYCFSGDDFNNSWLRQLWYEGRVIEFRVGEDGKL